MSVNPGILGTPLPGTGNSAFASFNPMAAFTNTGQPSQISGRIGPNTGLTTPSLNTLYNTPYSGALKSFEAGNVSGTLDRNVTARSFVNNPSAVHTRLNMLNAAGTTSNDPRFLGGVNPVQPFVYPNGYALLGSLTTPFPLSTYRPDLFPQSLNRIGGGAIPNALGFPAYGTAGFNPAGITAGDVPYPGVAPLPYPGAAPQVPNPYSPSQLPFVSQLSYPFVSQYPYQFGYPNAFPSGYPFGNPYPYSYPYPYQNPNPAPACRQFAGLTPGYGRSVQDCRNAMAALGAPPGCSGQICGVGQFLPNGGAGNVARVAF